MKSIASWRSERRPASAATLACLLLSTLGSQANMRADEPIPSAPVLEAPSADESVRVTFAEYVAAFNDRDAAALAEKWQPEGVFLNEETGERTVGRDAIAQQFQTLFSERNDLSLGGRLDSIRFVQPEVVCASGYAVTVGSDNEPLESGFKAILVRVDGQWRFDSIDERPLPSTPSPYEQLEELEFLVGRWVDDTVGEPMVTTTRWGANKTFLVRSYTMDLASNQSSQGTQVIGWDPRLERIRCWMFNSDGTFAEGIWSPRDDGWTVKISQTLANGDLAGATQVITILDQNTLSVQMIGQEIEGDTLPSATPVRVMRVDEVDESASE